MSITASHLPWASGERSSLARSTVMRARSGNSSALLRPRLARVTLWPAAERGVDQMPAEKDGPSEDQQLHGAQVRAWRTRLRCAPMPGWNFADALGGRGRARCPTRPPRSKATAGSRGPSSTAGPTASGVGCSALGVARQDKVAQYLYNCPEYLESMFGIFKAGLVPVNTNYRYADDELLYLWDNADAVAVVFHGTFSRAHRRRPRDRAPAREGLAVGRRRQRARAPTGPTPYEEARQGGVAGASSPGRGAATATTSTCSTPAARPACPRASCGARTTSSASLNAVAPMQRGDTPTTGVVDDVRRCASRRARRCSPRAR